MRVRQPFIVGLDAGTYKVCAVVAEVLDDSVEIVGIGTARSKGVQKGVVVNIDATVESIQKAIDEAELMAGCDIHDVVVALDGGHLRGFNSHGIVAIKNREVCHGDVDRVMDAARAVVLPLDRQVLHVLPQEFVVDGQDGIREPVGMAGVRLETRVHVVTGAVTSTQNLMKCCQRVGLNVTGVVAGSLAAATAAVTPEERELGVALLDVGSGATSLVVYHMGAVKHTAVLPVGGGHLTKDIAAGLRTPLADAEKLKQRHGCGLAVAVGRGEAIEVLDIGGRGPRLVPRRMLSKIIEPRLEEIFTLVADEMARVGCGNGLASGVVVTGGTAVLDGIVAVAERVFDMPVRVGTPLKIGGLVDAVNSPMYSTAVGLVLHARDAQQSGAGAAEVWRLSRMRDRIAGWLRDFF